MGLADENMRHHGIMTSEFACIQGISIFSGDEEAKVREQIRTITLSVVTMLHKRLPSLYLYYLFWNFNLLLIHKANENVLYSRDKEREKEDGCLQEGRQQDSV